MTQPLTAKPTDLDYSCERSLNKNNSESSDDTHKNLGKCTILSIIAMVLAVVRGYALIQFEFATLVFELSRISDRLPYVVM